MNNDVDHLRTYFRSFGPALNRSGLEQRLSLPFRCVRDWLSGKQALPDSHRPKLLTWARRYGYQEDKQYDQFV